jgi:hypothetical protein
MPLLRSSNVVIVGSRRSCSIANSGTRFRRAGSPMRGNQSSSIGRLASPVLVGLATETPGCGHQ